MNILFVFLITVWTSSSSPAFIRRLSRAPGSSKSQKLSDDQILGRADTLQCMETTDTVGKTKIKKEHFKPQNPKYMHT